MLIEVGRGTYFSPADLAARAAPIAIVDGTGAPFDPTECAGDRECLTMEVIPTGATPGGRLPMGLHIRSLEVLADDSLLFVGDPARFELPPATQSSQGEDFDRGAYGDGLGEVTISLIEIVEDSLDIPFGSRATINGRLATSSLGVPYASRVEIAIGSDGGLPVSTASNMFAIAVGSSAAYDLETELLIHAYDASDRYLGYDAIPLTLRGELGSLPPAPELSPTADKDSDGISNGDEVAGGTSTVLSDTDGDGLSDADELAAGLDPTMADTDGDGRVDGEEPDDGNLDGIPDRIDPDNSTIGLDANDAIFLMEERWTTTLGGTVEEEETTAGPGDVYEYDSTVSFTLTYALVAEVAAGPAPRELHNWLSEDSATPLPERAVPEGWEVRFRAVRLDAIGVPYVTEIEVSTNRCDVAGRVGQQCDLVPVQLITRMTGSSWPEHVAWVLPRDSRLVDGSENVRTDIEGGPGAERATYHVSVYPRAGLRGLDPSDVPLGGWGPIDTELGGAAHYLGADPSGQPVTGLERGRQLLVNSLQPSVSRPHFNGPTFVLCSRAERTSDLVLPVGHRMRSAPNDCIALRVDGNALASGDGPSGPEDGITEFYYDNTTPERTFPAIDLGFFGGLRVRRASPTDTVLGATYAVGDAALIELMQGREIGEIIVANDTSSGAGALTTRGYPGFLAQVTPGRGLQRLTRSVSTMIVNPGPRFVESVRRESFDTVLSDAVMHVEGTDTAWTGRVGYRSQSRSASSSSDAERPDSADWFRLHVALARPTQMRGQQVLEGVIERCRAARSSGLDRLGDTLPPSALDRACIAHLRVQIENQAVHQGTSRCRRETDPSDYPLLRGPVALDCVQEIRQDRTQGGRARPEAVVLSQDVPVDHLWRPNDTIDRAAHEGGVLLRWTGQPETYNTLNRLPGDGGSQGQFARIVGCRRFENPRDIPIEQRVVEVADTVIHPGTYVARAFMASPSFRGGPATTDGWTCSSFGAGLDPPVDPLASLHGPRQNISIGLPVLVGPVRGSDFTSFMDDLFGPSHPEVTTGMQDELTALYRDLGSGIDVAWQSDFAGVLGGAGRALVPFVGVYLAVTPGDETQCLSIGLPPDPGVGGSAFVTYEGVQARGTACVFRSSFDGLAEGLCRTDESIIDPVPPSADMCGGLISCGRIGSPLFTGLEALPPSWTREQARSVGGAIAWVGVHEIGHTAGLTHVEQDIVAAGTCTSGTFTARCVSSPLDCRGSRTGAQIHVGPDRLLHPMTSPARPITTSEVEACTAPERHAGISTPQIYYRPTALLAAELDPTQLTQRRILREATFAETHRGGRVLRSEARCSDGSAVNWFREDAVSLVYLRAQYGRGL